jgi:hypothetical protein
MKRSEMVQHIYEDLLDKLDHYKLKEGSDVWSEFAANELLDMIEGFGMLPPIINGMCQEHYIRGDNEDVFSVFRWEPEND